MANQESVKIGRFRVLRRLGRGLQGTVYLGQDDDLQRPVAIKVLHGPTKGIPSQARLLAKLRHPNVISLYEAGVHNNLLYLVFEYIEGPTLDRYLHETGKLSPLAAVQLIAQVVDALAHAHSNGIAHLDLSITNIMLDRGGVARIMDFDLSGQLDQKSNSLKSTLVGTPLYMAPEHFTTRQLDFRTDVYAAGTILFELLTGIPAITGEDNRAIIRNILNQAIDYSPLGNDPQLALCKELLQTATHLRPDQRYPHAGAMGEALRQLELQLRDPASQNTDTVGFLLRRMQRRQDFPALSRTLVEINQLTAEDSHSSSDQLARVILRDFGVTNKLLKLANSSFYARMPGKVKSVSDAIRILGLQQIRIIANSLLCFAPASKTPVGVEVRDLQMHAFLAGLLSRHLAHQADPKLAEEAFICGMLHTLGRYLVAFYLPEEFSEIQNAIKSGSTEQAASIAILGVTFEELGRAIAREWAFPDTLLQTMREVSDTALAAPSTAAELLHAIVSFANRVCALPLYYSPDEKDLVTASLENSFGQALPRAVVEVESLLGAAVAKITEFAPVLDLQLGSSRRYQLLKTWIETQPATKSKQEPQVAEAYSHGV